MFQPDADEAAQKLFLRMDGVDQPAARSRSGRWHPPARAPDRRDRPAADRYDARCVHCGRAPWLDRRTRCASPGAHENSDSNVLRSNPMALASRAAKASRSPADSGRARPGALRLRQPQPSQLQRRREAERAVDGGAGRRRVQPGRQAAPCRRVEAGIDEPGRNAAAAKVRGHQHHADPGIACRVGQQRGGRDQPARRRACRTRCPG